MAATPRPGALSALGGRLRALREAAGLSGTELAAALGPGWAQSKISRLEGGRQLPTEAEIQAWGKAIGADPEPLLALRGKASAAYAFDRDQIAGAGGAVGVQDHLGAMQRSCTTLLGEYQPALVPGLLQTASFRREMAEGDEFLEADGISPDDIGPLVAGLLRRQSILYEGGRRIVHVLGEAAMRTRVRGVSVDTMRAQLSHIADTVSIPKHDLGIVPFGVALPVEPLSGFVIYDSDLVVIETLGGDLQIAEPELIARYHRWLDQLLDVAVTGDAAAEMCRRVAADLA